MGALASPVAQDMVLKHLVNSILTIHHSYDISFNEKCMHRGSTSLYLLNLERVVFLKNEAP